MKLNEVIIYEMLILIASVLIFRSLWTILDGIEFMSTQAGIWLSLIAGVAITVIVTVKIKKKK